jgi:hypothetical protein
VYTVKNYRSKKAIREALAEGVEVKVFQPGPFGPSVPDGRHTLEGPHYPEPHRFYGVAEVKDGLLVTLR